MEEQILTLRDLRPGVCATVQRLRLHGHILGRLQDLGLIEGTVVTCCAVAPGGSPIAYRFRGAVIALRAADAQCIDVLPCHPA